MKKMLLSLALILALIFSCASAESAFAPQDILLSEAWVNDNGSRMTLNADGTGIIANNQNMEFELTWTLSGNVFTYTYNFYGERTTALTLEEKDGVYCLYTEDGTAALFLESQYADVMAAASEGAEFYSIAMGEEVNLGFVKMNFDRLETRRKVGGEKSWYPSPSGRPFLCLVGSVENTGNVEYPANNMRAEMVLNGEYTYNASVRAVQDDGLTSSIAPLTACDYFIFVELPEALENSIESCSVRFALNDQFKNQPLMMNEADFCFEVAADASAVAAAMEGPVRTKAYFEDCPILPMPTSYTDLRQTGSNRSSTNGKVTKISFRFGPEIDSDDIMKLYNDYLEGLKADGFGIKTTAANEYDVYDSIYHLASLSVDVNNVTVRIIPGNEDMTARLADISADQLKEYSDKATIKAVQAALNANGYECGKPDGAAGKKTKAAISQFQQDNGLIVTGTITHETLAKLTVSD